MVNNKIMFRPSFITIIDICGLMSHLSTGSQDLILSEHAASGCNTVSSLSGIGKTKLIKLIETRSLGKSLAVFYGHMEVGTMMLI